MSQTPLLICVVGPTAIGKTALAIRIAQAFDAEIISADSRQFYKEMRIGTAVPSAEELAAAPHHFIQNRSIHEDYSVGDFERDSIALLDTLFSKNPIVVMVGGSGLYVDALTQGLDNFPSVPSSIREQLNLRFEQEGIESLQQELAQLDPIYFDKVDQENHHRLIRALEICIGTGKPYSSFLKKGSASRSFETLYIGITADRVIVYDRINKRVDIMMEEGLLEEAKNLYEHKELNALQTVGYRELFRHMDREINKAAAVEEIKKNTRRFAKRQGTWFRKNEAIHWFDYETSPSEIIDFIKTKTPFPYTS